MPTGSQHVLPTQALSRRSTTMGIPEGAPGIGQDDPRGEHQDQGGNHMLTKGSTWVQARPSRTRRACKTRLRCASANTWSARRPSLISLPSPADRPSRWQDYTQGLGPAEGWCNRNILSPAHLFSSQLRSSSKSSRSSYPVAQGLATGTAVLLNVARAFSACRVMAIRWAIRSEDASSVSFQAADWPFATKDISFLTVWLKQPL